MAVSGAFGRQVGPGTAVDAKIDRKSVPGGALGDQNRSKIGPGNLSGHHVAPRSVPVMSRERLGSTTGRPRHAPGAPRASSMAPRDVKKSAQGRPGARRGHQNRRQIVLGCEKIEFLSRGLSAKHGGSDLLSNFVNFWRFPEIRKTHSVWPWPHGTGFGTC